jgi:UDP-GlcNAc:undecaprenyl-phosphate/decaprenyl-phosphate GlcNAc-1-phosphate transferase
MHYEIIFLLLLTFSVYKLFDKFAIKVNLIDLPNARSSHVNPTIRGFGIVIFIAIGLTLIFFQSFLIYTNPYLLCAVLIVAILGAFDDINATPPMLKIFTLIIAYSLLYLEGFIISNLGVVLGINIELNLLIAIIFSIFAVLIFTNSFNLIDGLDGLSGSIAVIIFSSFFLIGLISNDQLLITIPIFFITTLIVFLFYNWHPAKVFLGDSGSLMIGFVISILGIRSLNYIEPISILYIAAIPILDTLFVIIRRIFNGISPLKPDKLHLHHILMSYFNGKVKKTVILIAIAQIVFTTTGLLFVSEVEDSFIAFIAFILLFMVLYRLLNLIIILKEI